MKILTNLITTHPNKIDDSISQDILDDRLRKLGGEEISQQDQAINYVFTVMINNDKALRNEINQLRQTVEGNGLSMLDEIADLRQAINNEGGDQTPRAAKPSFAPSMRNN